VKTESKQRVNDQITALNVHVVMTDGDMRRDVCISDALVLANQEGLDLIQVSMYDSDETPICKLADYGKMQYHASKRQKQHTAVMKEIRFGFNTAEHDMDVKHKKVTQLLGKKHPVKYVMELKGRERRMMGEAVIKFNSDLEHFADTATWSESQSSGRFIYCILQPHK
jgi:translation initiation factor IF-3